ncbi:MAG: toxic anion resistance protein, partial [Lachnospiraceae bacterium]|nr:toxic anion resistance protein [Lachnospiraceae bacterium]
MAFSLDLPDSEEIKKQVEAELAPTEKDHEVISEVVKKNGDDIMNTDLDSLASRKEITSVIAEFGADLMEKSESKNSILQKRLVDIGANDAGTAAISKGIEDLSIQMRDLDPSGVDFAKTGFLGKLVNPVRRYFEKYKTADQEIAGIIESMEKGRIALKNDNTTLEIEEVAMRNLTKELNKKIELGVQLDSYLQDAVDNERAKGGDEDKIRFVEEEVLFPLRQRIMDFQQLLTVNQQGIIAMEVIRKNNSELIRSVDRAKTVTVSSLRVAVTIAGALYNQKIVLEKVNLLNSATNQMISATSKMLKEQGVAVQKQAVEANLS